MSSKAPVVFHWEEDQATGIRMRTRVSRNAVDQMWEQYSNKQCYFNAYHNEWDVCMEFDPDVKYPNAYVDNYDNEDDAFDVVMGADSQPDSSDLVSVVPTSVDESTPTSLVSHNVLASSDSVTFTGGLLNLLHACYGFLSAGTNDGNVFDSAFTWNKT